MACRGGSGSVHPCCHKRTPRVGAGPVQNQPGKNHHSMSVFLLDLLFIFKLDFPSVFLNNIETKLSYVMIQ